MCDLYIPVSELQISVQDFKGCMSHELLQCKYIAAIAKIANREGTPELVKG
jgi:hypothetical protein